MLENRILQSLEQRLRQNNWPIKVNLWNGKQFSGADPAKVTLSLNSPAILPLLVQPTLGRLAGCYVEEQVDLEGNIRDAIELLAKFLGAGNSVKEKLLDVWNWRPRHTRASDRRSVSSHYDVSNDFFALWLDRRRVYSCAYFKTAQDSLELAQEQKLDHICRKLDLQPGERLLDIGCGWGGLVFWAIENYGVHATGITVSQNQYDYLQLQIRERGIAERCQVLLMDYRDLPESPAFDKISSVGMFEHVGLAKLPLYFAKIHRLLRPGGLVLNHGITSATFDGEEVDAASRQFIHQYVFPDGELTHVSRVLEIMSRRGLEIRDVECLRPHYAMTLWQWVARLEAAQEEARRLVGEKKYRIWRAYMAGFAYAFETGWDSIYQILGGRALPNGELPYPLTREHVYAR